MKRTKILGIVTTIGLFLTATVASAASSDYNNDGTSDPTVLTGNPYTWTAVVSGVPTQVASSFGTPKSIFAPGDYSSTGTKAGYIASGGTWHVFDSTDQTFKFGVKKATYLAGADIDGDGKDDAIYYTNSCKNKKTVMKALADPLGAKTKYSVRGGKGNQYVTYGDVNGDGADDICYLIPIRKSGRFTMLCKSFISKSRTARFKVGKVFQIPVPISNGSGAAVYFALARIYKGKTVVNVVNTGGQNVKKITFATTGTVLVGDYAGTGKDQVALAKGTTLTIHDLDTEQKTTAPITEGTWIDDFNTGVFEKKLKSCSCTTKKVINKGFCPFVGGSKCAVNKAVHDGHEGWLHKPVSDSTHSIVNLFPASLSPTDCRYEKTNGQLIVGAHSSGRTNGHRSTWRPNGGGSCSSFPSPLVLNCLINNKRTCYTMLNPCSRYD